MTATAPGPTGAREQAALQFGRSFKATLAALRRLRGRETHTPDQLSDAQYGVLFCLLDTESRATGELALAADLSPAATTEMLEGLAGQGLVARSRSARDRRVVLSSLTERGRELVRARQAAHEPRFQAAMAAFSAEELQTAAAVLDRMRGFFDELVDERTRR